MVGGIGVQSLGLESTNERLVVRGIRSMNRLRMKLEAAVQALEESLQGDEEIHWDTFMEEEEEVIVVSSRACTYVFYTGEIQDYDGDDVEQLLCEFEISATLQKTEEAAIRLIVGAKIYPHHQVGGVPKSMRELEAALGKVVAALEQDFPTEAIVMDVHTSCALDNDCVIVGVRKKRVYHFPTGMMDDYDAEEVSTILAQNSVAKRVRNVYREA